MSDGSEMVVARGRGPSFDGWTLCGHGLCFVWVVGLVLACWPLWKD